MRAPRDMGRRRLACAVLGMAAFATPGLAQTAPGFLSAIADLPLTPGLAERIEDSVVFEHRNGRIVRAIAVGRVSVAEVRRFYLQALPALGWEPAGADRFVREGERLQLDLLPGDGRLTVRFALAPHSDSSPTEIPPGRWEPP